MTERDPATLRVLFMGTPEFALPSLRALAKVTALAGVVTRPDRRAGRGRTSVSPPVAVAAREIGLRVLQPEGLRDASTLQVLADLQPDLLVVAAYGRIIPAALLKLPPRGAINLHPSLLPAYRGASPIERAIADGATVTGVTVMHVSDELDAGDIILQRKVAIGPEETAGELRARLADEGAALLLEAIRLIGENRAPRRPQDHARATFTGRLTKADGELRWERSARDLVNQIRAMNPWPCAYTTWHGGTLKVWRARPVDGAGPPGQILGAGEPDITVAAGEGAVELLEVQGEGGRRMPAADFLRGHPIRSGDRLGGAAAPAGSAPEMVE